MAMLLVAAGTELVVAEALAAEVAVDGAAAAIAAGSVAGSASGDAAMAGTIGLGLPAVLGSMVPTGLIRHGKGKGKGRRDLPEDGPRGSLNITMWTPYNTTTMSPHGLAFEVSNVTSGDGCWHWVGSETRHRAEGLHFAVKREMNGTLNLVVAEDNSTRWIFNSVFIGWNGEERKLTAKWKIELEDS